MELKGIGPALIKKPEALLEARWSEGQTFDDQFLPDTDLIYSGALSQIRVVAWALITMEDAVLVQCDEEESFYRLPGGTVEVGETAIRSLQSRTGEESLRAREWSVASVKQVQP